MKIIKPRICVVGLGEIGGAVFREFAKCTDSFELVGVDIDESKFDRMLDDVEYASEPVVADYYIIAVWSMDQIIDVIEKIASLTRLNLPTLISIESTLDLQRMGDLYHAITENGLCNCTVTFPHRFMPGDAEHGVFNQARVLGGIFFEATQRGVDFYRKFVTRLDLIHETDFWTAAVSKVAENAYRAMEIILAQELKNSCEEHGTNFEKLRAAMNTKWNIDVREVRDGVRGKCLPKDLGIFTRMFPENTAAHVLRLLNAEFCNDHEPHA